MTRITSLVLTLLSFAGTAVPGQSPRQTLGVLSTGAIVAATRSSAGWGLTIEHAGMASVQQPQPVQLEFFSNSSRVTRVSAGYQQITVKLHSLSGDARLRGPDNSEFEVNDEWKTDGSKLTLFRKLRVSGRSNQGFLSAITFAHMDSHPRNDVDYFAPGMIYGSVEHLTAAAIGGADSYAPGASGDVQIREDRLPAPMFGVRFSDGSALTILDIAPNGSTTKADSRDTDVRPLIEERLQFGALGAHLAQGKHEQGFWFPGTEGEVTYRGNTYPGGQVHAWRRRYHPVRDGLTQSYQLAFRFTVAESYPAYTRGAWRWAYQLINPPIIREDLAVIQRSIIDVLASQAEVVGGRTGIPNFVSAAPSESHATAPNACMGFTGKQLESAELLLADAGMDGDRSRAAINRKLGLEMIRSFLQIPMNPPAGECFNIASGDLDIAIPSAHQVYLRSFSDDMKATMRAYRRERLSGTLHPEWLVWVRSFADWLLTQQHSDGGFPRSWRPGTGQVVEQSPQSSYNPIPMFVMLEQETGDSKYLLAAERAGEFTWSHGQYKGKFVGGTIDNPDILDKEAGTLSIEAYSNLYDATHKVKWLDRAKAAADYAETYIYIWNVPMAIDEDNAALHWKRGVPTYGTQLIATGHSLVDDFMAFNVADYARLSTWTGDKHYMAIAALLLHDTKSMVAIPGRSFDLKGPGWQQEHWSFAPVRGLGLHRGWLPWVATSQLQGIVALRELDSALFARLASMSDSGAKK